MERGKKFHQMKKKSLITAEMTVIYPSQCDENKRITKDALTDRDEGEEVLDHRGHARVHLLWADSQMENWVEILLKFPHIKQINISWKLYCLPYNLLEWLLRKISFSENIFLILLLPRISEGNSSVHSAADTMVPGGNFISEIRNSTWKAEKIYILYNI